MLRLVRSALRTADRLIQAHSSSPTAKLKQPLNSLIHNLRGGATHTNISGSRGLSNSALPYNIPRHGHQSPPYKSTLSLSARVALSRPLSTPFLPRTPALPRSVTQVGLGTARNFSSTRHVFQNLVENVPVSGRAWYEAGWDLKAEPKKPRSVMRRQAKKAKAAKIADKARVREELAVSSTLSASESSVTGEELSRYFPATTPVKLTEGVTTLLTIPLHPAAERAPLPSATDSTMRLLPLSELRNIHADHSLHATRVSSLFTRLDTADVWAQDVTCECYQDGTASSSPSSLRVVFKGWTREMVIEAIGEAGQGWCRLEEEWHTTAADPSSNHAIPEAHLTAPDQIEAATSVFIIPTLDFSSAFLSHSVSTIAEDIRAATPSTPDWTPFSTHPSSPSLSVLSDETISDQSMEEGWFSSDDDAGSPGSSSSLGLGFSVDFLSRGDMNSPPLHTEGW